MNRALIILRIVPLLLILGTISLNLTAQGSHILTGNKKGECFLIASLPHSSNQNHQKLKIEVLGGSYYNSDLGTCTYSISSRGAGIGGVETIKINQEQKGGAISNFKLKVYKRAEAYDFVIESTNIYMSIFVQAWLGQRTNNLTISPIISQEITQYSSEGSEDITSQVQFNIISGYNRVGDVGIGTDNPQAKLDVRGKIIADEIQIKVNKGADFVFSPQHNLKSLSEVEQFVKENQHLPEIPSEKEMIENGVNVNEMQIKLLQKIEELTLYLIEQKHEIKSLRSENQTIKKILEKLKNEDYENN